MSALVADERANPDSILYYAPPRHRRVRGETGIRPVLERLSRGEPSPSLLPAIADDDFLLPPPALSVLVPDPFSVVGKVATVAVCVAALAAGGVFMFGAGTDSDTPPQLVAAPRADRLLTEAEALPPVREVEPAAPETDASAPPPDDAPPPKETSAPSADIDVALIAPLKMWEMFPGAAAPLIENAAEPPAQAPRQASRHRRVHRARVASSDGMETQTASAQTSAAHSTQANPLQAALQKIFGAKQ